MATGKVRIFELAKELGMSSKELIALFERLGLEAKNQLSVVDDQIAGLLRAQLGKSAAPAAPKAAPQASSPPPAAVAEPAASAQPRPAKPAPPEEPIPVLKPVTGPPRRPEPPKPAAAPNAASGPAGQVEHQAAAASRSANARLGPSGPAGRDTGSPGGDAAPRPGRTGRIPGSAAAARPAGSGGTPRCSGPYRSASVLQCAVQAARTAGTASLYTSPRRPAPALPKRADAVERRARPTAAARPWSRS